MSVLSMEAAEKELAMIEEGLDILDYIDEVNTILNISNLNEAEYNKVTSHLRLDILDIERFVEVNDCAQVSDPRAFSTANIPSPKGLLSNEIFGYTMEERAGTFAYIDLHGTFIDPSCYKTWIRLDSAVKNIVHGAKNYTIDKNGNFVEDENGETGIDFLIKNINKIRFKNTGSITKDISIKYLEMNRNKMFIKKYLVIPPFYRDKNTSTGNSRVVGLGGVNKLYTNLITRANALTETQDYLFDASDSMKAMVQEIILNIYDWFCGNRNKNLDNKDSGAGMSGKLGILRRANMSKTANFSSRLVISAPELKVKSVDDMMVTLDKSAVPLYAVITQFRDFVMYHTRRFFENEFQGINTYPVIDSKGNMKAVIPKDPEIVFSDERIKHEMDRFLHGYNNRFVPIEVPIVGTDEVFYMRFKGEAVDISTMSPIKPESANITERRLTWCDIFFMSCVEAVKNKHVLITRFPIDAYTNQIMTKVEVSSTKITIPMVVNNVFYKYYPRIRESDIGTDTSNLFVDSLRMSNLYLAAMGGDYDGDQITCKGVYTNEANDELEEFMNSKQNFVGFGTDSTKTVTDDSIQAIYALTKVLSDTKITDSKDIKYS